MLEMVGKVALCYRLEETRADSYLSGLPANLSYRRFSRSGPLALALDAKGVQTAGEALRPCHVRTSSGQARAIAGRKNAKDV